MNTIKEIKEVLKLHKLNKRVLTRYLRHNEEGYVWLECSSNYYNIKSANKVKEILIKNNIDNFFIINPLYYSDRHNQCYAV